MSKAFDTVDRQKLLGILKKILSEDEFRLVQLLMAHTTFHVRVGGKLRSEVFISVIGTFQGDGLSPALFIMYLEYALRILYRDLSQITWVWPSYRSFFRLTGYAEDIDFATDDPSFMEILKEMVGPSLHEYNLLENEDKRENNIIEANVKQTVSWKKLGSQVNC